VHSLLVVVPIGCWIAALVVDVASRFSAGPVQLVRAGTWLTGAGLIGAVVAGVAGMVVAAPIPTSAPAHRRLLVHVGLVLALLVLYPFGLVLRLAVEAGGAAAPSTLAVSAAGVLVVGVTGWTGRAVRRSRRGSRPVGHDSQRADSDGRADSQP
jgi:uncharacterized membrane protein